MNLEFLDNLCKLNKTQIHQIYFYYMQIDNSATTQSCNLQSKTQTVLNTYYLKITMKLGFLNMGFIYFYSETNVRSFFDHQRKK